MVVGATQVQAALLPSYYTDRTAWTNDVSVSKVVEFTGLAPNGQDPYTASSSSPFNVTGIDFTTTDPGQTVYVQVENFENLPGNYEGLNSGEILQAYTDLTISSPTPFSSFGVDLRGYADASSIIEATTDFTIELSNGLIFNITVSNPTSAGDPIPFFGFASITETFSWVKISSNPDKYVIVDNVSFAKTTLPEPTSMAIFGLGALGFAARRFRRK
jgi:hypothetical protein